MQVKIWELSTFTGTVSVRLLLWSCSEEEQCCQIPACLLSIICTASLFLILFLFWGTDLKSVFHFSAYLASVTSCVAFFCTCTLTLMLNQASRQKCSGFASKKFWRVDYWFMESVALRCISVCVPLVKPPWLLTNVGSYSVVSVCWRAG